MPTSSGSSPDSSPCKSHPHGLGNPLASSLMHRATIIRSPGDPAKAIAIDAFISEASGEMNAEALRSLRRFEQAIVAKLATHQARQHRDLHESVSILCRLLRSEQVTLAVDPLPQALAEAAVALDYLLKGADIIPDSVPEIGLTDDARIVARVMERNPSLQS